MDDKDDQDREVSRRVDNPINAGGEDEAVYRAADPLPDDGHPTSEQPETTGSTGSTTEAAASELAEENESEPQRSE